MAEEAKKVTKPAAKLYEVRSMVRRVTTRTLRAISPTRHRFKLYIGGRRLLRNKSLFFTETEFAKYEKEIATLVKEGKVVVVAPTGEKMSPSVKAPVEAATPKAEAPVKEAHEEAPLEQETPPATDDAPEEEAEAPEEYTASSKKPSSKKRGK